MRSCVKCGNDIKNKVIVDNKIRNFQRRKFCLECSPFGEHNTRSTNVNKTYDQEVTCLTCNKIFIHNKKGNTAKKCGSCFVTEFRRKRKKKCVDYKGGKCQVCFYNRCIEALDFHHLDPLEKDFGLGDGYGRNWEKTKIELDKCILVCSNCHREIHSNLLKI